MPKSKKSFKKLQKFSTVKDKVLRIHPSEEMNSSRNFKVEAKGVNDFQEEVEVREVFN